MATIAQPQTFVGSATESKASSVWSWLTTIDHKRIGIMYGVTAFTMMMLGGLEAMLIRVQLARPENDLLSWQTYNAVFTMHGTTMIFLAIMPLSAAFFNYIIPLQIGARDVAFPRLNAFSFWVFASGAIILNLSWLAGAAPDAGWYGYAPLTENLSGLGGQFTSERSMDFWVVGLLVLGISSTAAALNFIVTILNMRAPGVTLMRMPIFTWATLITNLLIALAFPAITVALILLAMDRFMGTHFYIPSVYDVETSTLVLTGGDPLLWQHLFWIFGHPEVYILILPAFGIVSEIIPVFSRKPLFGYAVMVYALAAIAFLGFGVWVHHMFTTGLGPTPTAIFAATTMLIAIPTGVKIFNWVGTMWGGQITFTAPMLFAVGLVSQFTIGGISGVMHAAVPVDSQQQDTYFVVAHFHYVLFGGSIFALLAGIYYWFPLFTGKVLDDKLGKLHFWVTFVSFNAAFFPMHFLGLEGMPRRYATYGEGSGWGFWNGIVSAGSFVLGASFLIFIYNVAKTLRAPEKAERDPWDAATLEWTVPTYPPPVYNFRDIPQVTHRDAYWAEKYGTDHGESHEEETELDISIAGKQIGTAHEPDENPVEQARTRAEAGDLYGDDDANIHMPNPSFYPLIAALGLLLAGIGLIFSQPRFEYALLSVPIVTVIGVIVFLMGIFGWSFEPASDPVDDHAHAGQH